jgi:hypothetical protein
MLAEYPYLPEELVDNILVRIRPDDPAGLAKACLGSKYWCRHICSDKFLSRNRKLHPTAASLGFLVATEARRKSTVFVPTSTFHLEPSSIPPRYRALDVCHGRVLFYTISKDGESSLVIWDPITKEEHAVRMPLDDPVEEDWNAALLCGDDRCDELRCHDHESMVVLVGTYQEKRVTFGGLYSRELGKWNHGDDDEDMEDKPAEIEHQDAVVDTGPSVVLDGKAYFPCKLGRKIVEYDYGADEIDLVDAPMFAYRRIPTTMLMTARDGVLGFACVTRSKLNLWSREATGPGGALAWELYKVLDLTKMSGIPRLIGSNDDFIWAKTGAEVHAVNRESGKVETVSKITKIIKAIPYAAFWTPSCR